MKNLLYFEVTATFDINNLTEDQIVQFVYNWGGIYMEKFKKQFGGFGLVDLTAMNELFIVLGVLLQKHKNEHQFKFCDAVAKFRITDNVIVFNISVK